MTKLFFTASGTTNFYPYKFNKISKEREILFSGGVPLHKIVYNIYDFYYNYIHSASPKTITYLSLIINQNSDSRPETPYLVKLEDASSKKKRKENIKDSVPEIIEIFNKVFKLFITDAGMEAEKYRSDTNFITLKKAYKYFNDEVCPKLEILLA